MKLPAEFYLQDGITLARELLGKHLIRTINGQEIICKIVETEAYMGPEDKGAHTYNNLKTKRTAVIFSPGGKAYVYLIYGMYHCLNVVANRQDKPQAVLIRAVQPLIGLDIIKENRPIKSRKEADLTNGPGKLCQALDINMTFNGYDIANGELLHIAEGEGNKIEIIATTRINIDYAEEYQDKPWRFYIKDNLYVSKF